MTAKALVAYATKHGSTTEIAVAIGEELRRRGIETTVRPAALVGDVTPFDVVVVGSGVYMNRWHGEALDFLKAFERELRARSTWLFSSGPTGGSPKADAAVVALLEAQGPPPGQAGKWADRVGIRGHATFGGKVDEGLGGIFERWVPKGDWRDFSAIAAWARLIADAAGADPSAPLREPNATTQEAPKVVARDWTLAEPEGSRRQHGVEARHHPTLRWWDRGSGRWNHPGHVRSACRIRGK